MRTTAKHIGRIGARARALGVASARRTATRLTVPVGVVALVVTATVAATPESTVSPTATLSAESTALIMCGATCPTPDAFWVESVMDQFITPTHRGQTITPVAVTTVGEAWPLTGLLRIIGSVTGDPRIVSAAWPDEPWWKLSGLFDVTADQSIEAGIADLEAEMAAHPNESLVIYGYSQSTIVANLEKKRLAEKYPVGTPAPDIDFVLGGDFNVPNGGVNARFPGLYIPILDSTSNGSEPTDTQFHTDVIIRQYDGVTDFPLYPLNIVSLLNAQMGFLYVHTYPFDVSLPADPTKSPAYEGTYGDTSYYFFETEDLPLFAPLRTLGVPESAIDVVEPFFRVIVELGYDRTIRSWEPTPARLIPRHDLATVAADLVDAIGEGIDNAAALVGSPAPLGIPAAPATVDQDAAVRQVLSAPNTTLRTVSREESEDAAQVVSTGESQPPAIAQDDPRGSQPRIRQALAAKHSQINQTIGAVKSIIGNGRTIVRSAGGHSGFAADIPRPLRKRPVREAVTNASGDIKSVVAEVSDSIKTALRGGKGDASEDGDAGLAQ